MDDDVNDDFIKIHQKGETITIHQICWYTGDAVSVWGGVCLFTPSAWSQRTRRSTVNPLSGHWAASVTWHPVLNTKGTTSVTSYIPAFAFPPPTPERADQVMRPSCVDQWLHLKQRSQSIFTQASQNGTHKWRKKKANLSTYLCPRGIVTSPRFNPVSTPVIPCLLFLTSSQLISPSLWQIITLLRLVMLWQMQKITDGDWKKKHNKESKCQQRVVVSDKHSALLLPWFTRHSADLCAFLLTD